MRQRRREREKSSAERRKKENRRDLGALKRLCKVRAPLPDGRFFISVIGGGGWVDGWHREEERVPIQFMLRQCGFVSPNYHTWTDVHNPRLACRALSYHRRAFKYRFPGFVPLVLTREAPVLTWSGKDHRLHGIVSSIKRLNGTISRSVWLGVCPPASQPASQPASHPDDETIENIVSTLPRFATR